jgi:hypothetical protein
MSDPPRLLDHAASPLTSRLLRAGLDEQPSDVVLRRTLAAVGTGIAIASSTTAAAAGSGAAPMTLLAIAKWIGVGTLGGLVTIAAATQLGAPSGLAIDRGMQRQVQEAPTSQRSPQARAKPADISDQPLANNPAPPPSLPFVASHEKPAPPSDPPRSNDTRDPPFLAAPVAPAESRPAPLAEEVSFVDRGWAAIRSKEYARTLADLAVYERKFPSMSMLPEVLFLRMQAESGLGNADRARAHARSILSGFPQSPHSARARDILDGK